MLTIASVILAAVGIGVLVFMPMPREHTRRTMQQALGTVMFTAGIVGVIVVVFTQGQIVG